MDDRYARLESAVEQLRSAVLLLQQRVDTLESVRPAAAVRDADAAGPDTGGAQDAAIAPRRARRDPYDPIVVLTLIGRLFLVLAGGFFLRAMTEAGVLAAPVGVGLAFLYALVWLALADRASGRGQSSGALFHAIAAALVAFPLLIEGTTRFKVIGVGGSVLGLAILTIAFLGVAVRRKLHAVAWIAVVFALPTSAVLLLKTGVAAPFVLYLIALGVATVWLAYAHGWTLLRWPVALAADLAVVGATFRVLSPANAGESRVAVLLQVTLVAAYLGSIAVRTLLRDRNVTTFEVTQTVIALAVGFGGAVLLTRSNGTVPVLMGLASLGFGAACYALAFTFVGRHADHERNVHFYTSLALVLVLAGLALDLPGPWLGAVSASFAVLAAWAWSRYGRPDLLLHGTVYVVVAAIATGALRYATSALMASPERWVLPGTVMVTVAVVTGITAFLRRRPPTPGGWGNRERDASPDYCDARVAGQWLRDRLSRFAGSRPGRRLGEPGNTGDGSHQRAGRRGAAGCRSSASRPIPRVGLAGLSATGLRRPEDGGAGLQVLASVDAVHCAGAVRCGAHPGAALAPEWSKGTRSRRGGVMHFGHRERACANHLDPRAAGATSIGRKPARSMAGFSGG